MAEVIASCFIESIGTNVLLVKGVLLKSHVIIVCIHAEFYNLPLIPHNESEIESIKHAFENELISIQEKSLYFGKLYYSICINRQRRIYLSDCDTLRKTNEVQFANKVLQFATENRDLFERDGRQILK